MYAKDLDYLATRFKQSETFSTEVGKTMDEKQLIDAAKELGYGVRVKLDPVIWKGTLKKPEVKRTIILEKIEVVPEGLR